MSDLNDERLAEWREDAQHPHYCDCNCDRILALITEVQRLRALLLAPGGVENNPTGSGSEERPTAQVQDSPGLPHPAAEPDCGPDCTDTQHAPCAGRRAVPIPRESTATEDGSATPCGGCCARPAVTAGLCDECAEPEQVQVQDKPEEESEWDPAFCRECGWIDCECPDKAEVCTDCGEPLAGPSSAWGCVSPERHKPEAGWLREEFEHAKRRNAELPPCAQMTVTNPDSLMAAQDKPEAGEG